MKKICAAVLALILCLTLASCGGAPTKEVTPGEQVKTDLEAFRENSQEEFRKALAEEDEELFSGEPTEAMRGFMDKLSDFDYEILEETTAKDGKTAEVKVKMTTYPFGEKFVDILGDLFALAFSGDAGNISEEEVAKMLFDKLASVDGKTFTKEVTINCTKKDGGWETDLEENEDFGDAFTGGMVSSLETFNDLGGGSEEAPTPDLPQGSYEEVGKGTVSLNNASGSSANGDKIIVYPDLDSFPYAYMDYSAQDLDGSLLTSIYIDGVKIEEAQIGAGAQASLMLDQMWMVTEGVHKVEFVQFAKNDAEGEMVFYRAVEYTVK